MKNIAGFVFGVMLITSTLCFAGGFELEMNANNTIIEGRGILSWDWASNTTMSTGIDVISNKDNFSLYGLELTYGNNWLEGLKLDMGFKGVKGSVDNSPKDADIGVVGFLISGTYDFPTKEAGLPIDFGISARVCVAPKPLNFKDTENYLEFSASLNIPVLPEKIGMFSVGFRSIRMDFKDVPKLTSISDNGAFIGFKFKFFSF